MTNAELAKKLNQITDELKDWVDRYYANAHAEAALKLVIVHLESVIRELESHE